jgi:hypothetical protein
MVYCDPGDDPIESRFYLLIPEIKKSVNLGEKDFFILPKLHEHFPAKFISIVEVNCRFIDIYLCLGSILNAFHKEMYRTYP